MIKKLLNPLLGFIADNPFIIYTNPLTYIFIVLYVLPLLPFLILGFIYWKSVSVRELFFVKFVLPHKKLEDKQIDFITRTMKTRTDLNWFQRQTHKSLLKQFPPKEN